MMLAMKTSIRFLAPLVLVGTCAPALAQMYVVQPAPLQWYITAGPSFTNGTTAEFLENGWTVGTGFTVQPDPGGPFAFRTNFSYSRFGATDALINEGSEANQTQITGGNGQVLDADIDGVLRFPLNYPGVHWYLMGGGGIAHRYVELTQNVGSGGLSCGGWFSFCGPYTAGSVVAASDSQTHLTWNAGAGVDFALPGGQSWFVEARFEQIETAQPTQFIPVRVGLRF
jgi:opacity protein-like surface antigen